MAARARKRHARFRGYVCIVKGCTRVEYKHELCRKHWDEVPMNTRIGIMVDTMNAAMKASSKRDPEIRRWAQHYATGVANSQGRRA